MLLVFFHVFILIWVFFNSLFILKREDFQLAQSLK